MNIAITGHTKGIGLACSNLLVGSTGYSRSNGWNIAHTDTIVREFVYKDYDVVINNAYSDYYQTKLLQKLFDAWTNKNKIIISIGSYVIDYPRSDKSLTVETWPYKDHKLDLAKVFRRLSKQDSLCRLGLINPGPTDTDLVKHLDVKKIKPELVADAVRLMLDTPHIKEITLYD